MIELGEFDIKFMPKTAIKGQAIANFMVEFTYLTKVVEITTDEPSTLGEHTKNDEPTDLGGVWNLRIDGTSNVNKSGAGAILESLTGKKY